MYTSSNMAMSLYDVVPPVIFVGVYKPYDFYVWSSYKYHNP